jgi:beta-glucanase (GH16 family)
MHMKIGRNMALAFCMVLLNIAVQGQEWKLVWSDEFDGDSLDMAKWSYQTGTGSEYGLTNWGNNELEYYLEQNVVVDENMLTIIAKKEDMGGKSYTSGRIRTIHKGDWTYGRFEFRAKMPLGKGLWAAIWMMPTDNEYGGWAASGEIDMVEYLGHLTNTVYGTLHFGGSWPNNKSKGSSCTLNSGDFHSGFHDFAVEWEEGAMRFYVDGQLYQTLGEDDWYTDGHPFPAPFDKDFHLLINLAVGGNWPGSPDASTEFPQELVIDYVRVYERNTTSAGPGIPVGNGTFGLEQNYPNPFQQHTTIAYSTLVHQHMTLEVFDALGRKLQTLVDEEHMPGSYSVDLDGALLPAGHYTYRLTAGENVGIRQMLLL